MITLRQCVMEAWANRDLVREFDRLNGTSLARRASPIDAAIDEATGKRGEEMLAFIAFVDECVFRRLVTA